MAKNTADAAVDAAAATAHYHFRQPTSPNADDSSAVDFLLSRDGQQQQEQMSPNLLMFNANDRQRQTLPSLRENNYFYDDQQPTFSPATAGRAADFWNLFNSSDVFHADHQHSTNTLTVDVITSLIDNQHFKSAIDETKSNMTNRIFSNVTDFAATYPSTSATANLFAAAASAPLNNVAALLATTVETTATAASAAASNQSCEGWLWAQGSAGNFSILTIGIVADAVIVLLNCIVLLSFAMQRGIRRPSNLYILNLALCDLMTGVNTIPYRFTMDVSGCWPYSSLIPCRISTTLSWITINEAAFTIVLIAYDRLLKVQLGAAFAQKETVNVVVTRLACSWASNIVLWTALNWVHVFTGLSLSERSACHTEFFQLPIEAVIVILMLSYFVPPLVCCMIYVWVWKLMFERRKKLDSKRNNGVGGGGSTAVAPSAVSSATASSRISAKDIELASSHSQRGENIQLLPNGNSHHQQPPPSYSLVIVPDGASMASIGTNDSGQNQTLKPPTTSTANGKLHTNGGAHAACTAQQTNRILSSDGSSRRRLAGGHLDRMTRMLILISCIFMILWLPNGILAVTIGFVGRQMQLHGRTKSLYELYTNLVRVTMIAQYCLYFNSAINPVLYAFGFPAIREAMIKSVLPRAMWIRLFASPSSSHQQQQQPHRQSRQPAAQSSATTTTTTTLAAGGNSGLK